MATDQERLDNLWQYSLMDALSHRRSSRFPRGCEIDDAPYPYKSEETPIPLTELETAVMCWAAHGISGAINGDLNVSPNTFDSWIGRTHPNPCNDQHNYLLFVNDDGLFVYNPTKVNKQVSFETPEDRMGILDQFHEGTKQISDQRPDIPAACLLGMNVWKENQPGVTTFMPVNDMTYEYVNMLFCAFGDEHWVLLDDETGEPAGIKEFVDSGFLNGASAPVSMLENLMVNCVGGTGHYMLQNLGLAAAALGLNGHPWGGYVALILMGGTPFTRGLGFHYVTGKDKQPTPIGIDGFIEALVPPYTSHPDEIVDIYLKEKYGEGGMYSCDYDGPTPFNDKGMLDKIPRPSEETIACVRAYVNYIYDRYGRFPAKVDAVQIPSVYSCTHADLDFYNKYYNKESISDTIRQHMALWHE